MENLIKPIAQSLNVEISQVANTLSLIEEGNTVPFIARYRKEMTKGLDEEQILYIQKEYDYQVNLQKRKEDVLRLIETQGKLTPEIQKEIDDCTKLSQVDDIYRPYQQKKKTRATDAIAKGLEPLADWILKLPKFGTLETEAAKYVNEQCPTVEEAISGAKDIIAERVSDDAKLRWKVQENMVRFARIVTKEKKDNPDEAKVYKMYYDYSEKLSNVASHRIMAINRAIKEKVISEKIEMDEEFCTNYALRGVLKGRETICKDVIEEAVKDGLKRLLFPSVQRAIRSELTEKAQ